MPEKPITKGLTPEVKQVLENLKTTNPNEYNKLGQSIFGQTDPMLRNKVIEQFKADPMGYINKYKAPVTPAKPKNTFDDYYTKGTIPTVQGFKIDSLGNKSSVNNPVLDPRFKEAKSILQNFYDLKIQNPSNPLLKEEIYKVDKIAKVNPTFKNSETYKLFESDKIDYISKATGFNGIRDEKEYDAIIKDPKKLMKVGFEYSSFDPGQLGYTKDFYDKINPDLDKIANAPTDKPLKLSNGETLSKDQVVKLKANLTKTGREFAYKQYQDNFQNKILPELEKVNTEFKNAEKALESSITKLKGVKDKATYNKIYKEEYEPLKAKYTALYDTMYRADESLKYDEKKLQTIVNGKTKEEQRVQQWADYSYFYKSLPDSFVDKMVENKELPTNKQMQDIKIFGNFFKAQQRGQSVIEKTLAVTDIFKSDLNIALQHIDPVKAPIAWFTGKVDKDGNPVMSNQVMWYENKDDMFPSFNLGAVAEEGAFQTINMIGVGKLTGLLGGIVAKGANLASKHYSLTNTALNLSARNVMNAGIPIKWGTSGLAKAGKFMIGENLNLGARALTFPSVYATTYGRNYVENINNFRTISEAKDYAISSSTFESLTESIVPDVFFFSKTGLNKLGTILNNKQFGFYKQFLADAAKGGIKKANLKALGASLGQMGINTLQEALIEEELNYFAMSKYEDIKSEEDPLYVRQQEKATFEGAVDLGLESLATMSISMLSGLKGQYNEHKQAYGYDFSKPENLAYHRFNVAVNADLLKESILNNKELSKEDKIKQLEIIEKYQSHLKNASQAIQKPNSKTLANDEDNIYAYFHASTEKEKLEEKILNGTLSPSEQKKYDDFQLLIDKLDKENNDWARLEPEQRQNTWWKWYRESITESKDNDLLKNSLLFAQDRAVKQKNIVKKQYEDGHITREMYDQFMSNIGKAEQQIQKSRKAKIQTNLDRLDELSERELGVLQADLELDKALDNENTIVYNSKPTPLELKSQEPLITYNEVLDNLPKDFAVDLTYTTPGGKEYNILAIEENGLLVNKKTGEVIPKEVTVKKAATIQPTINDVRVDTEQEFTTKKNLVKNRFEKIYSERLSKTFDELSPELQSKIEAKHQEFNKSNLTIDEFRKELNDFVEQNLPENTDDQTKDDVVDLILNKSFIENKIKAKEEVIEEPVVNRVDTVEAFTSEKDMQEEIDKLQEQLSKATDISSKILLKKQIKKLQAKLDTLEIEQISSKETPDDSTTITPKEQEVVVETPPIVTKVETVPTTEKTKEAPVVETPQTKPIIIYNPNQKVTEAYIRKNAKKVGDKIQVTFPLNDKHGVVPEGISNPLTISTKRSLEDLITMLLYDQSNMEFNKSNPLAKYRGLLYLLEDLNKVDSYDKLSSFAKATFNETKKELEKAFERFKNIIIETPNDQTTIQNIPETTDTKTTELVTIEAKKADIEIGKVGNTEYEVKADGVYWQGKKLNNPENKTHRQLIEADIERRRQEKLLGKSFTSTTEKVVTGKGQSAGKTIVRYTESKVSSDGEVLIIKPKAKFKNEDTSLSTTPETITVKEFRELFYENLSEQDKEMFDEFFTDDSTRIKLVEARIGLKGNAKGQVNIDIESLEGQPFGFELQNGKEINAKYDAELKALEQTESNKEIKKDTSIQDNKIVSLYKELTSTGKLKFTDEEGKPC